MEIFRKVYCEQKYEGVYQLIRFDEKYLWQYIAGTHVGAENDFDYPNIFVITSNTIQQQLISCDYSPT